MQNLTSMVITKDHDTFRPNGIKYPPTLQIHVSVQNIKLSFTL